MRGWQEHQQERSRGRSSIVSKKRVMGAIAAGVPWAARARMTAPPSFAVGAEVVGPPQAQQQEQEWQGHHGQGQEQLIFKSNESQRMSILNVRRICTP